MTTAYLFPGQGSQYPGMGRELEAIYPPARDVFLRADEILGFDLSTLCFEGPEEELKDTYNTQPALLAMSIAALRGIEEAGCAGDADGPAYVAGHSMGEFSALVAAGALTLEHGLRLVRERGRVMKHAGERSPGGMAAVLGLSRDVVESICEATRAESGQYVGIANDNCPGQSVISGTLPSLERAMAQAKDQGARRVVRLAISIGAHSPLMAEAASEFRSILKATPFGKPATPFVANTTARPLSDPQAIRQALGRQLTSPVRWSEAIRWMIDQGVDTFVEVGPKDVLTRLVRRIDRGVQRFTTAQALGIEE